MNEDPITDRDDPDYLTPEARQAVRTTIFLGYTSNLVSSGVRDVIRFLVKHRLVDVLVTTAGGVEEDFIKCLAPTYLGEFNLKGADLRRQGINRIGNLMVPNHNYCLFEDWVNPILDQMLLEQQRDGVHWTPSKMIERLGREINNEESIYYWAARNNIPVFSPALTDGSLGDMMYFHSYRNPGLVCDIIGGACCCGLRYTSFSYTLVLLLDIRRLNDIALRARHTGCIILGGGVVKHHIMNANLMRNGADHTVYINTAQEFDGSDSGAAPDEAVSWGKIRLGTRPVKIYGEASIIFPLLVAQTFAKPLQPAAEAAAQASQ